MSFTKTNTVSPELAAVLAVIGGDVDEETVEGATEDFRRELRRHLAHAGFLAEARFDSAPETANMTVAQATAIRRIGATRGQGVLPCVCEGSRGDKYVILAHSEDTSGSTGPFPHFYWNEVGNNPDSSFAERRCRELGLKPQNGDWAYISCTHQTVALVRPDGTVDGRTATYEARLAADWHGSESVPDVLVGARPLTSSNALARALEWLHGPEGYDHLSRPEVGAFALRMGAPAWADWKGDK